MARKEGRKVSPGTGRLAHETAVFFGRRTVWPSEEAYFVKLERSGFTVNKLERT